MPSIPASLEPNKALPFDWERYGDLLKETLPAKIRTEDEHRRLLGVVTALCSRENLSPEEVRLFDLVGGLVKEYEDEHFRPLLPAVSPLEMVKYLMEQRGLKAKDMVPLFNSRGLTSDILNGKRQINKNQAKKLAEFFQVTVDVFL